MPKKEGLAEIAARHGWEFVDSKRYTFKRALGPGFRAAVAFDRSGARRHPKLTVTFSSERDVEMYDVAMRLTARADDTRESYAERLLELAPTSATAAYRAVLADLDAQADEVKARWERALDRRNEFVHLASARLAPPTK